MKKFLSLVLALVMTMSLVTVSAGAKDFTDSGELSGEQYAEAVNVMSEMGIIDGYAGGDFRPQGTLTRGAAAKIIACMMLGKTTAEALGTQAAPFKDVPVGSTFAGYIAYCVESGLIDGYADGTFRPSAQLTGFAFLKMLLTALGYDSAIEGFTGTVGTNVSGPSDLAPLDQQAAMIYELFPDAETVGLIYCSAEANSQYQVDTVKAELEKLGYTCELYPFADSNDAAAVTQTACDASDVIYLPTDNTVASNTGIVDNICQPAGVPVVAGEEGIVKGCGVATLSISYYDLGVTTGKMAAQILTGEADISSMPIAYAEDFTPKYNPVICEALGLTMPENYVAIDME